LVVAQSSSEVPEGLMNNPVCLYYADHAIGIQLLDVKPDVTLYLK
jgi:hypothetical protein